MGSFGQRAAEFLLRRRWSIIFVYAALTAFFAVGVARIARNFQAQTSFADLIPGHNPVTDVFKRYQDFSKPATVEILLKVKHGTIYTPSTLARIWRITRELDLVPGIDHVTLTSIASEKIRVVRPTPSGASSVPVMTDVVPRTEADALAVRARARHAAGVAGILVSPDEKATLIDAAFFEKGLDYGEVFNRVHRMLDAERDPDIEFYPAGRVMLIGWIYRYGHQAFWIFLLSLALIILAHVDYMRSLAGALTPIIAAAVSTVWGLGAGGWMGLNLEPLTVVVPVLLMARALSHSLQITRRYYEILYETHERVAGAAGALASMFAPACLGIMCDVAGLYMICLAPIPIIQKLGLLCGTWSLLLIPSTVLLTPVLLAILPPPRDVSVFITHEVPSLSTRLIEPVQRVLAGLLTPRTRVVTAAVALPVAALIAFLAMSRPVGNVAIGSPLLWPGNEYNVAEREINRNLAGTATLNVVWEGKVPMALFRPQVYDSMRRFQLAIERKRGAEATLSIADYIPITGVILRGGNPKWLPVDLTGRDVGAYLFWTLTGHSLENFSQLLEPNARNGDVILWYKDLRAGTVEQAMAQARRAVAEIQPEPSPIYNIRIGTGLVALQYALDHVVRAADLRILVYLLATIFVMCVLTYYSAVAAAMLLVPLILAQFATDSVMYLRGVGLDVNTLPVVAVGLGVGIDYGIYLLSRICEEFQGAADGDVQGAVTRALFTTGEATFFVAFTMVLGVLPWYFLSELRFLAEMGLMLALVMAFNGLLAMTVLPLETVLIRPRFLGRVRLMRRER
jgi:predicted RND superfamily exporter protein